MKALSFNRTLSLLVGFLAFSLIMSGFMHAALAADDKGGGHSVGVKQPPPDASKAQIPARVTLAEPKALSKISGTAITLKWNAAEGADAYHVQVASDSRFKWIVSESHNQTGTTYEVSGLQPKQSYFWRVAARKTTNDPGTAKGPFSFSSFETQ